MPILDPSAFSPLNPFLSHTQGHPSEPDERQAVQVPEPPQPCPVLRLWRGRGRGQPHAHREPHHRRTQQPQAGLLGIVHVEEELYWSNYTLNTQKMNTIIIIESCDKIREIDPLSEEKTGGESNKERNCDIKGECSHGRQERVESREIGGCEAADTYFTKKPKHFKKL